MYIIDREIHVYMYITRHIAHELAHHITRAVSIIHHAVPFVYALHIYVLDI